MAENSSTNGNSWTILAPEVKDPGVESVGPLSEGQAELHVEAALAQSSAHSDTPPEHSDTPTEHKHPPEPPQVTPLESSEDAAVSHSTVVKGDVPSSIRAKVENLTSLTPDPGEQRSSGDASASKSLLEAESFSDSYTHLGPSPLSAKLSGAGQEEEEKGVEEERLSHVEEKGELRKTPREECKLEGKANEGDGLRRRNIPVLTPVYHGDDEEEEGEEEQYRHPQGEREGDGDIGFTLNKCIFGALVLLGLGTIFFSGVLMDLDDEGDADAKGLNSPGVKKEWLNLDAQAGAPGGVQPPDILDKLAMEDQQIASLQAQLQEREVKLKAAQLEVEEGTKERLRREELEAENQRMRGELDKLPVLQKEYEEENEKVKRESEKVNKELEALPVMQKELERLRDQVTELAQGAVNVQAATPSAGHDEVPSGRERKEKKDWDKVKEKKEWKKDKSTKVDEHDSKGKSTKAYKAWEKEEEKPGRHKGEGKRKQKDHKQEDSQRWKPEGEKRALKERSGKKAQKEDKKWDHEKHGESVDRTREKKEKGKKDKEWKLKSEPRDWKEEKEWKKGKQASRDDKEWKEKREQKKDWKEKKEQGGEKYSEKERSWKGKKEHHGGKDGREEREEKHRGGKEKHDPKRGERTEGWKEKKKDKEKTSRKGKHDASHHSYSDPKHAKDHAHVDYWAEQREKIRHYRGSTEGCADVTACAHAQGLAPVSQPDFEEFILGYLTKLFEHGDQTSRKEKLSKLIGEFFTDGVFVHDQIPFSEFVEDVADILEDMADGDDDDIDDDDDLEDEMKGFATEAMKKFVLHKTEANEEKRERSGRKRMKG